jgi:hypothetical protein
MPYVFRLRCEFCLLNGIEEVDENCATKFLLSIPTMFSLSSFHVVAGKVPIIDNYVSLVPRRVCERAEGELEEGAPGKSRVIGVGKKESARLVGPALMGRPRHRPRVYHRNGSLKWLALSSSSSQLSHLS